MCNLELLKMMETTTITSLVQLTQELYAQQSTRFNATREQGWEGWNRCLHYLPVQQTIRVLDIGCGNGRFGSFLRENLTSECEIEYVGIDSSRELIEHATTRLANLPGVTCEFQQQNLVDQLLENQSITKTVQEFDLISMFGLLHHIPSHQLRSVLLSQSANLLSQTGQLWLSFWLFAEYPRFLRKAIDPRTVGINPYQLEEGDYLLPWDQSNSIRYCHYADTTEQQRLITSTQLRVLDSFAEDGTNHDLNRYFVLQNA